MQIVRSCERKNIAWHEQFVYFSINCLGNCLSNLQLTLPSLVCRWGKGVKLRTANNCDTHVRIALLCLLTWSRFPFHFWPMPLGPTSTRIDLHLRVHLPSCKRNVCMFLGLLTATHTHAHKHPHNTHINMHTGHAKWGWVCAWTTALRPYTVCNTLGTYRSTGCLIWPRKCAWVGVCVCGEGGNERSVHSTSAPPCMASTHLARGRQQNVQRVEQRAEKWN